MSKGILVAMFIAVYTAIVFWFSASCVMTCQKPTINGNEIVVELWGEEYSYQ